MAPGHTESLGLTRTEKSIGTTRLRSILRRKGGAYNRHVCRQAQTSALSGFGKENGTLLFHAQHPRLIATGISPSCGSAKLPFEKLQEKESRSQVGDLCWEETWARSPRVRTPLLGQGSQLPLLLKAGGNGSLVVMGCRDWTQSFPGRLLLCTGWSLGEQRLCRASRVAQWRRSRAQPAEWGQRVQGGMERRHPAAGAALKKLESTGAKSAETTGRPGWHCSHTVYIVAQPGHEKIGASGWHSWLGGRPLVSAQVVTTGS